MTGVASSVEAMPHQLFYSEQWDCEALPFMSDVIARYMAELDPPFIQAWYGDRYRDFAIAPEWLARSLVANAEKEADGARKLYEIARSSTRFSFSAEILSHAEDEARHARMYISMLGLIFPDALDAESRSAILRSFPVHADEAAKVGGPKPRALEILMDEIVQMNIGEIRTRLHQMLLQPIALAICPAPNSITLKNVLRRIYDDEGRHILYTACILERLANDGWSEKIHSLYRHRLDDFSRITLAEVGVGQFD
jgi:hypothetical protein